MFITFVCFFCFCFEYMWSAVQFFCYFLYLCMISATKYASNVCKMGWYVAAITQIQQKFKCLWSSTSACQRYTIMTVGLNETQCSVYVFYDLNMTNLACSI